MRTQRTLSVRRWLRVVLVLVLAVSTTAYALADRYLIEHVEIANVSAAAAESTASATAAATTTTDPSSAASTDSSAVSADSTATGTAPEAATVVTTPAVTYDDWSYQSGDLTITITPVTTGSGSDTVTYFVADVVINDATQLASAFAKNAFGTNIIQYTSEIAAANDAVFAINGDYYGFREDGIVIRNGVIYRDAPARVGLAFYRDGTMQIYDETQTSAQALVDAGVWNTLSFGPGLVDDGAIVNGLDNVEIDTNFGNHSIQGNNPRTGIGLISANHFVFVVVDGRSPGYSRGVTLTEFAQIFVDLGATEAYNIDGGGSSTMYFLGRVVNNPLGRNQERGTSDILYVGE